MRMRVKGMGTENDNESASEKKWKTDEKNDAKWASELGRRDVQFNIQASYLT